MSTLPDELVATEAPAVGTARSVPPRWVRSQFARVGRAARAEIAQLRILEEALRSYRETLRGFAVACERVAKDREPLLPAIERTRRTRAQRLMQHEKIQMALEARKTAAGVSAWEGARLLALVPWTDGLHVLKERIDAEPRRRKR
jgi:hypothetical protein